MELFQFPTCTKLKLINSHDIEACYSVLSTGSTQKFITAVVKLVKYWIGNIEFENSIFDVDRTIGKWVGGEWGRFVVWTKLKGILLSSWLVW